jgi:hypothetical protein
MTRTWPMLTVVVLVTLLAGVAAAADVNVNIGWPPPLIIERPQVVVVPETRVYRAPKLEYNVFVFGGKYYSLHNDQWFMTVKAGAPWTPVVFERVPIEVRAVPVKYYKIPPGHAKKMKDRDHDRGHGRDEDDDHGRGKHHDKGCPPGLAREGRC